jgi:glucose/arabinose dehydrogenase
VLSHNGTYVSQWGEYGRGDEQFRSPTDIALTSTDLVLIADKGNNRIVGFNIDYAVNQIVQDKLSENITINNPNLHAREIATDLQFPTAIAFLDSQDIIVLERFSGVVKRIVNGSTLDEPLLNISNYKIGSCMCGIDIAKRNNTTYVFLYIAELQMGSNIADRLYRYELVDNNTRLANPKILLDIPISSLRGIHHGGKVLVGPDSYVYVIIGDIDGRDTKGQNVAEGPDPDGSSSILRITVDGEAVNDNNTLGNTTSLNKYYGYGVRNSFGFDFDPVTNRIWFTDNGPSFGDEINFVEPGFNGGYRQIIGMSSLKKSFDENNLVSFDGKGRYSDPQFEWLDPIGPTAVTFLDSAALGKEYQNDLFVGDIENGNVYHFELNQTRTGLYLNGLLSDKIANNLEEANQVIFARGMGGITDMKVDPDGIPYVVSASGQIYAITPSLKAANNSTASTK